MPHGVWQEVTKPILNRAVRNQKERRHVPKRRIKAVKGAPMGWIVNPLVLSRDRSVQAELGGRNNNSGHTIRVI